MVTKPRSTLTVSTDPTSSPSTPGYEGEHDGHALAGGLHDLRDGSAEVLHDREDARGPDVPGHAHDHAEPHGLGVELCVLPRRHQLPRLPHHDEAGNLDKHTERGFQ